MTAITAGRRPVSGIEGIRRALGAGIMLLATVYTNAGVAILTNRVAQGGTAAVNVGWGTGTTAPLVTDTALQTEVAPTTAGGRTVGTATRVTTTVTNDTNQVVGLVTATLAGPTAITEMGLFDNVTAGNMLLRGTFAAYNTVAGDTITFIAGLKQIPG